MMKALRFIPLVIMFVASIVSVSCNDDEETITSTTGQTIVGTWTEEKKGEVIRLTSTGTCQWYSSEQAYKDNKVSNTYEWEESNGAVSITSNGKTVYNMFAQTVGKNKLLWRVYRSQKSNMKDQRGYYTLWRWARYGVNAETDFSDDTFDYGGGVDNDNNHGGDVDNGDNNGGDEGEEEEEEEEEGRDKCRVCSGTGNCSHCHGAGGWHHSNGDGWEACTYCHETGKCSNCNGLGYHVKD